MPGVFHGIAVLGPEVLSRRPAHPRTAARRSHHVHEAAHTELLPHWDGRWWDGSHFAVAGQEPGAWYDGNGLVPAERDGGRPRRAFSGSRGSSSRTPHRSSGGGSVAIS